MIQKLFMVLLGCKPEGRNTEQHDIFFGIAESLEKLMPAMKEFWPDTKLHIDVWREVTIVNEYSISVIRKTQNKEIPDQSLSLFFVNLGGYEAGIFDEPHERLLIVAKDKADAIKQAEQHVFFTRERPGVPTEGYTHVDNKFEVDDIVNIRDILVTHWIAIEPKDTKKSTADMIHVGYLAFSKI